MKKYEYSSSNITDLLTYTDYLNEMGNEGWELISVVLIHGEIMAFFKREK